MNGKIELIEGIDKMEFIKMNRRILNYYYDDLRKKQKKMKEDTK